MKIKPIYGYIALRASDPEMCKAGSSLDPVNRPENTWSDEEWVVALAFIIGSRVIESEWKRLLAQHRVGTGGTEIFRTAPMWDYAIQHLIDFRTQRVSPRQPSLGGPISIPIVTLGEVETRTAPAVTCVGSIQRHSVSEVEQPKSPYLKVGQKAVY